MTRNPPEQTGPVTRLPYVDLELDAPPVARPPSRLYVVAPTMHAFDAWCYDHRVHPRNPAVVAVLPANFMEKLRGTARGLRYVDTEWDDFNLMRWRPQIAEILRARDAAYISDDEFAAWWVEHRAPMRPGRDPIVRVDAAMDDMLINGPDGGRREAFDQAQSDLWWARIRERFGDWGDSTAYALEDVLRRGVMSRGEARETVGAVIDEAALAELADHAALAARASDSVAGAMGVFAEAFGRARSTLSTRVPQGRMAQAMEWLDADEERAPRNTPEPDAMICAHVCGADPDHECQARATDVIEHSNLAGGTTRMPVCGPCHQSERAALEASHG